MKKITQLVVAFSCTVFFASGQNLITNGSFENFLPPCPTAAPNGAFIQVLDWRPANDIPGLGPPHPELFCGEPNYGGCLPGPVPNVGSDGIAYVGFHTRIFSPPYNESIYQLLATPLIAGNSYTVSFDLMDCQSGFFVTGPSDFCVYTNIDTVIPACPTDNPSVIAVGCVPFDSISNTAWKHHTISFVAPPNSNVVAFSGAACNISEIYYYLDNVVLTSQAMTVSFVSSNNHLCPGTCTDFTNLSANAASYQWIFSGANPSVSTDVNPSNICYSAPGTYDVTLIASNGNTTDTLTLNNYITVYPTPPPQGILQVGDTLFANAGSSLYQWYYGGNAIAGATDYFYVATQDGDYNVVATDANGCEVEAAIFDVMTDVNMISGFPFSIYPNPADDQLEISISRNSNIRNLSEMHLKICNVLGSQINIPVRHTQETKLIADIQQLSQGIYFIELSNGNQLYRSTFFKN